MQNVSMRKLSTQEWATSLATGAPAPEKPVSVVEVARDELAERLGLRKGRLRSIDPRWTRLLKAGALAEIHAPRERFEVGLGPEDMGVRATGDAEKAMNSLFKYGTKRLLPERWPSEPDNLKSGPMLDIDQVDDQARYYLWKHSTKTYWGAVVAEGAPHCDESEHGALHEASTLAEHLQAEHPEVYARFEALYKATFGDLSPDEVDVDEMAAFKSSYPEKIGLGAKAKERGWHFRAVKAELENFAERYMMAGMRIVDQYEELIKKASDEYAFVGYGNYERLRDYSLRVKQAQGKSEGLAVAEFEAEYGDLTTFVKAFVQNVMRHAPTKEQVAAKLSFEVEYSHIPLSSEIELDRLRSARFAESRAIAESEARVALARIEAQVRVETAEQRLTAESLEGEARALETVRRAKERMAVEEEQERSRVRRSLASEMERTIASKAEKRLQEQVFSFVDDARQSVRSLVYDTVREALEALKGNDAGKLPGGSVKSLRNLLDGVQALDLYGEPDLEAKLNELRGLLVGAPKDRPTNLIESKLRQLGAESRLVLMDLNRPPKRSARELGIPDEMPELETMLRARRSESQLVETVELESASRPKRRVAVAAL